MDVELQDWEVELLDLLDRKVVEGGSMRRYVYRGVDIDIRSLVGSRFYADEIKNRAVAISPRLIKDIDIFLAKHLEDMRSTLLDGDNTVHSNTLSVILWQYDGYEAMHVQNLKNKETMSLLLRRMR